MISRMSVTGKCGGIVWDAAVFAEPENSLINGRVVRRWGYSNTMYMVLKIALVTDYGLISVLTGRWHVPHG